MSLKSWTINGRVISSLLALVVAAILPSGSIDAGQARARLGTPPLTFVGQTGGKPGPVAIQKGRAYEVFGTSLVVIDVNDPTSPRFVSRSMPLGTLISDVAVAGNWAYLATSTGILVLDVSSDSIPAVLTRYELANSMQLLAATESYVYALVLTTANIVRLHVLKATQQGGLIEQGSLDVPSLPFPLSQVIIRDSIVFITAERYGVMAIDVSRPRAPALLGAYEDIVAHDIAAGAHRAFVVGYSETILGPGEVRRDWYLLALSLEAGSLLSQDLRLPLGSPSPFVMVSNDTVYIAQGIELLALDGGQADGIPVVASLKLPWSQGFGPNSVASLNGHMYFGMNGTCGIDCQAYGRKIGIIVVDSKGGSNPSVAGAWLVDQPSSPFAVVAGDGFAAVSDDTQAIHLVDTHSPTMPTFKGAIEMDTDATDMAAEASYVLEANSQHGKLYDVTEPDVPVLLDTFALRDIKAVALRSSLVYAVGHNVEDLTQAQLVVWEITSERRLHMRGSLALGTWPLFASFLVVQDGVAFLGEAQTGMLWLLDVRDPDRMSVASRLAIPRRPMAVESDGHLAYVATQFPSPNGGGSSTERKEYGGLTVVNISDLASPVIVGTYKAELTEYRRGDQDKWGIAAVGEHVALAMHEKVLRVLDVTDPAGPIESQLVPVSTWAYDVAVAGDFAYVAAREDGLLVFRHGGLAGKNEPVLLPLVVKPRP